MNTTSRVAAFVVGLGVVLGGAGLLGSAVGPIDVEPAAGHADHEGSGDARARTPSHDDEQAGHDPVRGLASSEDGYTLRLEHDRLRPGPRAELAFRIEGPTGAVERRFAVSHDKLLHLVVVSRDLTRYHHEHPVMDASGTWRTRIDLSAPGVYRVLADFLPEDRSEGVVLGADLVVPGEGSTRPLPAAARSTTVGPYVVDLDGALTAGDTSPVTARVTRRDGAPMGELQPYLGARGHLVVLRADDLAYLHVHPTDAAETDDSGEGASVGFDVEVPTTGRYRMFLDFRHGGRVRTAAFTADAGDGGATGEPREAPATPAEPTDDHSSGEHAH